MVTAGACVQDGGTGVSPRQSLHRSMSGGSHGGGDGDGGDE